MRGWFKALTHWLYPTEWKMQEEENTELWLITCFTGQKREEKPVKGDCIPMGRSNSEKSGLMILVRGRFRGIDSLKTYEWQLYILSGILPNYLYLKSSNTLVVVTFKFMLIKFACFISVEN
jgi:hypothetical protein